MNKIGLVMRGKNVMFSHLWIWWKTALLYFFLVPSFQLCILRVLSLVAFKSFRLIARNLWVASAWTKSRLLGEWYGKWSCYNLVQCETWHRWFIFKRRKITSSSMITNSHQSHMLHTMKNLIVKLLWSLWDSFHAIMK